MPAAIQQAATSAAAAAVAAAESVNTSPSQADAGGQTQRHTQPSSSSSSSSSNGVNDDIAAGAADEVKVFDAEGEEDAAECGRESGRSGRGGLDEDRELQEEKSSLISEQVLLLPLMSEGFADWVLFSSLYFPLILHQREFGRGGGTEERGVSVMGVSAGGGVEGGVEGLAGTELGQGFHPREKRRGETLARKIGQISAFPKLVLGGGRGGKRKNPQNSGYTRGLGGFSALPLKQLWFLSVVHRTTKSVRQILLCRLPVWRAASTGDC